MSKSAFVYVCLERLLVSYGWKCVYLLVLLVPPVKSTPSSTYISRKDNVAVIIFLLVFWSGILLLHNGPTYILFLK